MVNINQFRDSDIPAGHPIISSTSTVVSTMMFQMFQKVTLKKSMFQSSLPVIIIYFKKLSLSKSQKTVRRKKRTAKTASRRTTQTCLTKSDSSNSQTNATSPPKRIEAPKTSL